MAAHEDLGVVLVQGTLVVADGGHVLDDDGVVRVLVWTVEDVVRLHHVVDDVGLGDLLGPELLVRAQVLAVVVAEVVVAGDRRHLDAGVDEELDQRGLHLGLARLEVVAADEGIVPLGEIDDTGDEGVLGRAVDERRTLEDAGDGEDGRRSHLGVAVVDGSQDVVGRVVDALDEVGIAFGVGGPLDDDLVQVVLTFEVATGGGLSRRCEHLTRHVMGKRRNTQSKFDLE